MTATPAPLVLSVFPGIGLLDSTLTGTRPPRFSPPRPTAFGDSPIYSVTWTRRSARGWTRKALVHGVMGLTCRVTICALDFIDVPEPYVDAEITCLNCLAKLGELYGDRSGDNAVPRR